MNEFDLVPSKPQSRMWRIVIGFAAVLAVGGLAVVGYVFYRLQDFNSDVRRELIANSQFVEAVGELLELEPDYVETGGRDDGGIVFRVEGASDSGIVIVLTRIGDDGDHHIIDAVLKLEGGANVRLLED